MCVIVFADVSAARAILGYQPKVSLEPGLTDLAEWKRRGGARDLYEWLRNARSAEQNRSDAARQKSAAAFRKPTGRNGFAADEQQYVYDNHK
jgi:hypothetical protein